MHNSKRDSTEDSHSITSSQTPIVSGYRLTQSIISVCRRLPIEAISILCKEISLKINITTDWTQAPDTYPFTRANLHTNPGTHAKVTILDEDHIVEHNGNDG